MISELKQSGAAVAATRIENLVAAATAAAPDALAVAAGDATLTYAELDRRAERVARLLRRRELGPDRLVGLCLDRSAALLVGALGILKAGAAYVALDPSYPDERLRYMLRDSAARVLVTTAPIADRLDAGVEVVPLDLAKADPADDAPAEAPASGASPAGREPRTDAAYVIYTSGSTGAPKGVVVEHASLLNVLAWHRRTHRVTPADRATQLASPGFDAVVLEVWPYLTMGASIHVPPAEVRTDPAALRDWIVRTRITQCFLPTPLAEAALELDWPADAALRRLLTGGDALHRWPRPGLPFTLVNNYGPTEATVLVTSTVVEPRVGATTSPPIGLPIPGARLDIVDRELRPVAAGQPGELVIAGPVLARGYLHRPELAAERFLPDPARPGGRRYRTGDLVRQAADGSLEFLGRLDDQVKVRGFRIELGEIAAVLDTHPAVGTSVAAAVGDDPGTRRLVAYVVPRPAGAAGPAGAAAAVPNDAELRRHLARHLPEHMLPAQFVRLEALPLTIHGKLDRSALPAPDGAVDATPGACPADGSELVSSAPDTALVAPDGALEEAVGGIAAELLNLPAVGREANFFVLGGHSLLGAQLVTRLEARFGVAVPLRAVFDNPTVAALAAEVERLLLAELDAMTDEEAAREAASQDAEASRR